MYNAITRDTRRVTKIKFVSAWQAVSQCRGVAARQSVALIYDLSLHVYFGQETVLITPIGY